ncbi:hypothetical protein M406DRAFT_321942 [Cryphonectria parasitica EP155]|uniref:Mating factor alpha n=1 Tax=Cryphonectria parasitica (strain ATCC 38755 / EP155) TaxID=660469 RepID=A0A9P5CPH7_CRYP1|nr:uncharacterized protein M406DRAFT_321942 [Cryphonectria parasitica EP155]KAF3765437.1 hypothetical protein M406DRAFT_321942 [Cryphonectria parasitica EP155]
MKTSAVLLATASLALAKPIAQTIPQLDEVDVAALDVLDADLQLAKGLNDPNAVKARAFKSKRQVPTLAIDVPVVDTIAQDVGIPENGPDLIVRDDAAGYTEYGAYGDYTDYPPAEDGYGQYGDYGIYPPQKRAPQTDDSVADYGDYGTYGTYDNYPVPEGGYALYGDYGQYPRQAGRAVRARRAAAKPRQAARKAKRDGYVSYGQYDGAGENLPSYGQYTGYGTYPPIEDN